MAGTQSFELIGAEECRNGPGADTLAAVVVYSAIIVNVVVDEDLLEVWYWVFEEVRRVVV